MHAVYFICILLKLLKKKKRKEKRTLAHDHAVGDGARIQTFNTCALHPTPRGLNQFWRQRDLQNCLTVPGPTLPGSAALSTAPQLLDDLPSLPLTPQAAADSGLRPFQGAQLTTSCLAHLSLLPISTAFPYSAQKEHSKGRDPNFPKPL